VPAVWENKRLEQFFLNIKVMRLQLKYSILMGKDTL
jgi:hypothetical protein